MVALDNPQATGVAGVAEYCNLCDPEPENPGSY
jgi:hypothetical protein